MTVTFVADDGAMDGIADKAVCSESERLRVVFGTHGLQ